MAGIILFKYYEPRVDIVITGKNSYKVLLWYNNWNFSRGEYVRRYIKVFKVNKV